MIEEQRIEEKNKSFYLLGVFNVFKNLTGKHSSKIEMLQRKVVKYGRRTKNMREDEKLLPFLCYFSQCSWISQENINPTEKYYKEK